MGERCARGVSLPAPVPWAGSAAPLSIRVSSGRLRVAMEMGWMSASKVSQHRGRVGAQTWDLLTSLVPFQLQILPSEAKRGHSIKAVRSLEQLDGRAKPLTSGFCVGGGQPIRAPRLFPRLAGCYGDAEAASTRPGKLVRSLGASVPPVQAAARRGEAEGVGRGSPGPHHRTGGWGAEAPSPSHPDPPRPRQGFSAAPGSRPVVMGVSLQPGGRPWCPCWWWGS